MGFSTVSLDGASSGGAATNGTGVNNTVNSQASLAALPTANAVIATGAIIYFSNNTDSPASASVPIAQAWQLVAATDATGSGRQRPTDYDGSTNARVWYQIQ